jgi:uncharacterized protein (TIGR02231 family)
MKKIIFGCAIVLLIINNTFAQSTNAILNSVTVYSNGAELNHTAKVNVPSGSSEIIIKNVSGAIDENSIQVGSNTDLTIMSVSFVREFLSEDVKTPAIIKLQDSLKSATNELEILRSQIATQKNAMSILDANKIVRGENTGLQVAELQKMVEYYIAKHKEITIAVQSLTQKETKQIELVNKLQNQVNESIAKRETGKGEVRLQVMSNASANTTFTISYVTYTAAWSPVYDLKTKDTKSPLKIIYKANIVQNTGLDWNKVKLSVSTSNPSQSGTMPILSTWFLNYYTPSYGQNSYGYKSAKSAPAPAMSNQVQSFGSTEAEKLEDKENGVNDFTTTTETALNATFDIDLPYDIPTDNKAHSVAMKEYEVPAMYKYYSVPKMDKEAFLVAEIADWESLNLVAGPANIIFDGTYVGKSFIDPNSTQDTLNISLGRDKKLIVKREKVQDYCSSKLIGTNKLHTVTYEIKVKNTRKEAINLLLKDQLPITTQKDIEVSVIEITGDAMRNEETGVLTWKLEVAPNETKKVRIQYSVKYPKDKQIGNLN